MAFAHVGARLIDGLMSVVVFLTPAHAEPRASADASAMPLSVLVPIISNSCNAWVAPQIVDRGQPSYLQTEGRWEAKNRLTVASLFTIDLRRWRGTRRPRRV